MLSWVVADGKDGREEEAKEGRFRKATDTMRRRHQGWPRRFRLLERVMSERKLGGCTNMIGAKRKSSHGRGAGGDGEG